MTASPPAAEQYAKKSAAPGLPSEEEIRQIIDAALNSAIPEPWEVSAHATQRILSLTRPAFEAMDAKADRLAESVGRLSVQLDAAETKLAQAVEALEPFADENNGVMQDLLWGDLPDTATGTITIRLGHIRAARAVVREFRNDSAAARKETT